MMIPLCTPHALLTHKNNNLKSTECMVILVHCIKYMICTWLNKSKSKWFKENKQWEDITRNIGWRHGHSCHHRTSSSPYIWLLVSTWNTNEIFSIQDVLCQTLFPQNKNQINNLLNCLNRYHGIKGKSYLTNESRKASCYITDYRYVTMDTLETHRGHPDNASFSPSPCQPL